MRPKGTLGELAKGQWTVVAADQLELTRREVQTLVDNGHLHRRHRGIYSYGTDRPPVKGVLLAAMWSCGEGAYLTGRTALGLAGVRGIYLGAIEIAVPRRIRHRGPPQAVQIARAAPGELRHDGPLGFATVPRALLDMAAAGAQQSELKNLIDAGIRASRLRHPDMRALLKRHPGHPGINSLRTAYGFHTPEKSAKSGLERSFDRGLAQRPHIPDPEHNTHIWAGGINWEIDRLWRDRGVGVELHGGPYHDAEPDRAKDELKAAKLKPLGIELFVISDTRWELEPNAVLDDLESILAAALFTKP